MYWYVSEEKIHLIGQQDRSWNFWPKHLTLKLKEPFSGAEVQMEQNRASSVADDFKRVRRRLEKQNLQTYETVASGVVPLLCLFDGPAARIVDSHGFWCSLASQTTALLLVGSESNAIGGSTRSDSSISPSSDPVSAIKAAFRGNDESNYGSGMTMPRRLSYAWQVVWKASRDALSKPNVVGVAVVAGLYAANKAEMRRANMRGINKLVIASPVYVQQVE